MRWSKIAAVADLTLLVGAASIRRRSTSLADLCTLDNLKAALPSNGTLLGINLIPSAATATAVYNSSSSSSSSSSMGGPSSSNSSTNGISGNSNSTSNSTSSMAGGPSGGSGSSPASYPYCEVTVAYTHPARGDTVNVKYAFPQPSDFKNRFYVAGGGGYTLASTATGGLEYGAAGGATDAGYDAFNYSFDEKVLAANGSINWDATYAFGYVALGEMTVLGKSITSSLYNLSNGTKIYTYYEGCSDGGREGMSQVQQWGGEYDGVIAGAPAFRYAQQQVNHIFSSVVEHTLDYYPPPCALEMIVNATIAACDPLDGRTDGVVSRTDLCMLNFNISSLIGESYYCASSSSSSSGGMGMGGGGASNPTQNGTITAQDVAVAQAIYDGLHDSSGQRAYLSWQIASEFGDAGTTYNNETSSWELSITSTGGEYIQKFVNLVNETNLSTLDGVTYDTVVSWMRTAYYRYLDSLQTTIPDLTPFHSSGGKLLHYHGESDPSIPSASSVHYWQSVRSVMYPSTSTSSNTSLTSLSSWYQLYLVPGAAHCGTNSLQPGPYPQNNMVIMIDWVENGNTPTRLNATVSSGTYEGETQMLCQFPYRPLWPNGNSSSFDCVYDESSIETWTYSFPAFGGVEIY